MHVHNIYVDDEPNGDDEVKKSTSSLEESTCAGPGDTDKIMRTMLLMTMIL